MHADDPCRPCEEYSFRTLRQGVSLHTADTHRFGREAHEREQMLDRLSNLRRVLPALAQEMAVARRQAARLRSDNRRLSEQVRRLRKALEAHEGKQS